MSDVNPRTIYKGRFVAKEKLDKAQAEHAELKAQLAELDDMLVVSHLGTLDSFKSVAHAVRALVEFDLSAEKYFDGQQLAALREAIVLTDENNVRAAKMLLMFTKPDVDNYLLTGIVVNMALPGLKALQERGE